jgi:hypothetical protein
MAGRLEVEVVPWGVDAGFARAAGQAAVEHPAARAEVGEARTRVLSVRQLEGEEVEVEASRVRATVYDYDADRTLLVDAALDGSRPPAVASTAHQPLPSAEERQAALSVLERDPELGAKLREGALTPFRPMPPLLLDELPDGRVERTVTVGLRPREDAPDEIVGVRLGAQRVVRFDERAPSAVRAGARRCGLANAGQPTVTGESGAARITVRRDGEVLWRLIAVRPAASVGTNGSGVELRAVSYRGKRVLRRAQVSILMIFRLSTGILYGLLHAMAARASRSEAEGNAERAPRRCCLAVRRGSVRRST